MKKFCVLILLIFSLIATAKNILICEGTIAKDDYIRKFITQKMMKSSDDNYTLIKSTLNTAYKKLKADEVLFITSNHINFAESNSELSYIKYNTLKIGVIVNKENPLETISFHNLKRIFSNQVTSWSFLIPDNKYTIHRFGLNENSVEYLIANRIFPAGKSNNSLYYPLDSNQDIVVMVESNQNSIGLIELDKMLKKNLKQVKLLKVTSNQELLELDYYVIFKKSNEAVVKNFLQ